MGHTENNEKKVEVVDIYKFIDYRKYLIEIYNSKKRNNLRFSYTTWGIKAGYKSRSYIRLVVTGKRNITLDSAMKIIPTLKIGKKEQRYFLSLINFNQALNLSQKELYWNEVLRNRQQNIHECSTILNTYKFLSSHRCPQLQVLTSLDDIDRSIPGLSKALDLKYDETREYLEILKTLGLVELEDGQWIAKNSDFKVKNDMNNIALKMFHKKSLNVAIDSLETDATTRHYRSMLMPLSSEEHSQIVNEIEQFAVYLQAKYGSSSGSRKRLYQLNVNNIPISNGLA